MQGIIEGAIWFLVGDYYVTFAAIGLVIGLIVAGVRHRWRRPGRSGWRTLLDHHVLWAVGVANAVNFVFHSFLGDQSAALIGWAQSPFQLEVALASLGMAVAGFIAFPRRSGWIAKLVAVISPAIFLFGAGAGHIWQQLANGDQAFANSGPILYSDLYLPIVSAFLLVMARLEARRAERPIRPS